MSESIKRLEGVVMEWQTKYAILWDKTQGTPCEQIRWQQTIDELRENLCELQSASIDVINCIACIPESVEGYMPPTMDEDVTRLKKLVIGIPRKHLPQYGKAERDYDDSTASAHAIYEKWTKGAKK